MASLDDATQLKHNANKEQKLYQLIYKQDPYYLLGDVHATFIIQGGDKLPSLSIVGV